MPGMDGVSLRVEILKDNKNKKVIVASGSVDRNMERKIYEAGAKTIIQQPFSIKQIIAKVKESISD